MNMIEKCARQLFKIHGEESPHYAGVVRAQWRDLESWRKKYWFKYARQLLKEMGLTDTQIEALGKENTKLAVVYKDSEERFPEYNLNERMDSDYNYKYYALGDVCKEVQQDMLAQGWCKKVEG